MISFSTRIIRRPIIVSRQKIIRLFSLSTTNVRQGKESHLRADEKSTTCFWAPRVVFYGIESPVRIDQGSILVNNDNGIIEACFHGETKEQAFARGETKCTTFVDLSSINTAHSSRRDNILSPGLIDVHTHISTLGRNWEGYSTATAAAAKGGVTSIIGMPLNSLPPTCSVDMVEKEIEEANNNQSKLHVDVGLWAGVLSETASLSDQLEELLRHPNVLGIKAFLCPLPPNAGYQAVTPKQLLEVAKMCGSFNKPILVHSELMTLKELDDSMQLAFPCNGSLDNSYDAHVKSRPTKWEQDAVNLVVECTNYCDMHVVHLSDAIGCLPIIERAKEEIQKSNGSKRKLTIETCPHYLLLDTNQIQDGDTKVKCFPPLREKEQGLELLRGLSSGLIDMIASDHSPCEPYMRKQSLRNAWGGLTGLQYQLQATWTAAKRIDCDIDESDIARWWSFNPTKLIGLTDRGSIEPGKLADFVLWDSSYFGAPDSYAKESHRWKGDCFYSSQKLFGRVLGTWKKGTKVYDGVNDELITTSGSYIRK